MPPSRERKASYSLSAGYFSVPVIEKKIEREKLVEDVSAPILFFEYSDYNSSHGFQWGGI